MNRSRTLREIAAVAAAGLLIVGAHAQDSGQKEKGTIILLPPAKKQQKERDPGQVQWASQQLQERTKFLEALEKRAAEATKAIGELASSGKLTASEEALALMKEMVQQLQEIRDMMQQIQREIEGILGWIEGQNEALPIMAYDIEDLKRGKWSNYVQFQFTDTQEGPNSLGGSNRTNPDGFAMRRFRMGTTNKIDSKTSMKLSFDVSSGSTRTSAELKDAILKYDIIKSDVEVGTSVQAGQIALPLGYELERSSSEREFPERALYNRTMFAGERGRGAYLTHGIGGGTWATLGVWNALTVADPQQTALASYRNPMGTTMAMSAGLRHSSETYEVGISGFVGERPGTPASTITSWTDLNGDKIVDPGEVKNTIVPATSKADRQYIFIDGVVVGFLDPKLTLRAEAMFGKDRVPTISSSVPVSLAQSNVKGYHIIASYNLNYRNTLAFRYEFFDPGYKVNDDVTGYGLSYIHYLNPGAKLVFAHEVSKEQGFDRKNNVTTLRVQLKL